ncbi:MAG: class I SAM-dependent methyltransferase [Acidimicrobiia bacterium]|nr:class I SAM-dependent methyltransferase [Acidimicrobiia bacterium]
MDGDAYEASHGFVWELGAGALDWLDPRPGETVLDLGCGGGQLTAEIAEAGASVTGVDLLPDLIDRARARYPGIEWVVGDIESLDLGRRFDAVFSNAVLHWVQDPSAAASVIAGHLGPGGRLVAEFGGRDNCTGLIAAIRAAHPNPPPSPWWFPDETELTEVLGGAGLEVDAVTRFARPTPLPDGPAAWVRAFAGWALESVEDEEAFLADVEDEARATRWDADGWTGDYVRIRVRATRR